VRPRDFTVYLYIAIGILIGVVISPNAMPIASQAELTLTRAIDGDTVELSDGRKVRLRGWDTPEITRAESDKERALGRVAKRAAACFEGSHIELTNIAKKPDRYGRTVANVRIMGGVTLAQYLCINDLAKPWDYEGGQAKPDWS